MSFIRKIKVGGNVYLAEVENKRINGRVVQRHIRYVGKEVDGRTILSASLSDVSIEQVKLHGPLLILNHLAQEIGLSSLLGEYGDELLSLVYAHCLDYRSVNQMVRWYERTDLNMILHLEGLTESRLLAALDSLQSRDAVQLQKEIFQSVKSRYDLDDTGIVYDVTNTYLYGKKCPLGKLGHDKEGVKGRPLIQIGLAVTRKESVPVFHKVFDGNTHDARTFQDVVTDFRQYGIRRGLIVFDRGISSEQNQLDVKELSWKVLCGLPIRGHLKGCVRSVVSRNNFLQYPNRIRLQQSIFYARSRPHSIGCVKGTMAICFNERLRRDIKESRCDEIAHAQALIRQNKRIKPGLEKYFDRQGNLMTPVVKKEEEFDGYSCLFTTAALRKEEMVRMCFDKDIVEKAFQSLKGVVRVRPVRHWLYNRVSAHVFVCYLSYLLLSLLNIRLKKIGVSPVEALRELDSLDKVYMKDTRKGFKVSRLVALNRQQEKILKTVDKKLLDLA